MALVGYTNSGKSTLFNRLTGSDVLVADQLFATLDTRIRRMALPEGVALLTDTVGFIRDLPHALVPAFQATLGAVRDAAALLLVVDASSPAALDHLRVTREVLSEVLGPGKALPPVLHVLNKLDLVTTPEGRRRSPSSGGRPFPTWPSRPRPGRTWTSSGRPSTPSSSGAGSPFRPRPRRPLRPPGRCMMARR